MAGTSVRELMLLPPLEGGDPASRWLDLGDDPEPSTRDRLLYLTMYEVARVGPAAFNTRTVCAELGIAHPMVHYYFGSRDGLIAEAAHRVYARFLDRLCAAIDAAPRTPVDRLRACLTAGLRLNIEMRGWGAVLNYYPSFSSSVAEVVAERFQDEHTRLYERNLAVIAQLVTDVWVDRVTDVLPDEPEAPSTADQQALETIGGLMFGVHGMTVWRAGHVATGDGTSDVEQAADAIAARYLDNVIALIVASRPGRVTEG